MGEFYGIHSFDWAVAIKDMIDDDRAFGLGQEFGFKSNNSTGGNQIIRMHITLWSLLHVKKLAFAHTDLLDHRALVCIRHNDGEPLEWLSFDSIFFVEHYFGLGNLQFITFPAHGFN